MSMTEIARKAGVSVSTVSLVLNNKASIPPATADKVRAAMRDLNYTLPPVRERHGRPPRRPEVRRIGVIADMPGAWLRSPVYVDALHGVEEEVRAEKGTMLLLHSPTHEDLGRIYGDVDALVLFGEVKKQALGPLDHLPCVRMFGGAATRGWSDRIMVNEAVTGELVAHSLQASGHRLAAIFSQSSTVFDLRRRSLTESFRALGGDILDLDATEAVKIRGEEQYADPDGVGHLLDTWLASDPRPTAIFLGADIFAPAVYLSLYERGIRPGIDVKIITCNNEAPLLSGLRPRPTIVDIQARQIGKQAVARLLWRMAHPHAPLADILVQPVLLD